MPGDRLLWSLCSAPVATCSLCASNISCDKTEGVIPCSEGVYPLTSSNELTILDPEKVLENKWLQCGSCGGCLMISTCRYRQ